MTRQASTLSTAELVARVRHYSASYSANRHKGEVFRQYAEHVQELLDRLDPDNTAMHLEYAPVLGGVVIDSMAVSEPDRLGDNIPVATRFVTPWRTDEPVV